MANIHSQKKRILRTERERLENSRYTSTIKTYFRRLEAAVAGGDAAAADAEHRSSSRRSTRPSSAARCTATPARARSPAPPASGAGQLDLAAPRSGAARPAVRRRSASIARSAAVSSASSLPAARGQLQLGERLQRASAARRRRARARLLDPPVRRPGAALASPALTSAATRRPRGARRSPARRARRRAISGTSRASVSPWRAQLEVGARRRAAVARDERVDERPRPGARRRAAARLDLLDADRRARAVLERELLELAQQSLLALADVRRRAPGPPRRRA